MRHYTEAFLAGHISVDQIFTRIADHYGIANCTAPMPTEDPNIWRIEFTDRASKPGTVFACLNSMATGHVDNPGFTENTLVMAPLGPNSVEAVQAAASGFHGWFRAHQKEIWALLQTPTSEGPEPQPEQPAAPPTEPGMAFPRLVPKELYSQAFLKGHLSLETIVERLSGRYGAATTRTERTQYPDYWIISIRDRAGKPREILVALNSWGAALFPTAGFADNTLLLTKIGPSSMEVLRAITAGHEGYIRAHQHDHWTRIETLMQQT